MARKNTAQDDDDQYWLDRARGAEKSGLMGAEETMAAIEKRLKGGEILKGQITEMEGMLRHLEPDRNMTDELLTERRREAESE